MKSIKARFLTLIIGCLILSCTAIGVAGVMRAEKVIRYDTETMMNLLCENNAQRINAVMLKIEQSVNTLHKYAESRIVDVRRLQEDVSYAEECFRDVEEVAVNAAENTDGAMSVYIRYKSSLTDSGAGLFCVLDEAEGIFRHEPLTDITMYSPDETGRVGWWYTPLANGGPTWMKPYQNDNIDAWMISYIIPIYADGEPFGVVGMDIDFSMFEEITLQTTCFDSGYAFVVDDDGNLIYHPSFEMYVPVADLEGERMKEMAGQFKMETESAGLFSYTIGGIEKNMVYRPLQNGMRFVLTAPTAEIYAEVDKLISQVALVSVSILLLAIGLTVWVTGRLVKPLQELNIAAQKIAGGDMSVSIGHHSEDEVGELAESFRQTVEHLKSYISYINKLAYQDAMTGVRNKAAYLDEVKRLEERMAQGETEFAVLVCDINNLKQVNDSYGHTYGDALIKNACSIVCETFRNSRVYRIGGDEFVILLQGEDLNNVERLLKQMERRIDDYNSSPGTEQVLSMARGLASYDRDADENYCQVFKRADQRMYENKQQMKTEDSRFLGDGGKSVKNTVENIFLRKQS